MELAHVLIRTELEMSTRNSDLKSKVLFSRGFSSLTHFSEDEVSVYCSYIYFCQEFLSGSVISILMECKGILLKDGQDCFTINKVLMITDIPVDFEFILMNILNRPIFENFMR